MTIIEDKIGEVVASMRNLSAADSTKFGIAAGLESPFYFYGHPIDINRQMIDRDMGTTKGKVYPAVALRLPVVEEIKNGLIFYTLNIAILDQTKKEWDAPTRMTEVIKPVLIPLYELLLDRLKKAGFFWVGDQKRPPHTMYKRPHHGVEETQGNKAYVFAQPLDAIELVNLKLNYNFKQC